MKLKFTFGRIWRMFFVYAKSLEDIRVRRETYAGFMPRKLK